MKGSFSFIVRGDNLDFDGISTKLHLSPTEQSEPEDILELLQQLTPNLKTITEMIDEYNEVSINSYMRSDYGQMGFMLSNEMLRSLAVLGIAIKFHILSFGMVE
ncbi:hypothetical protein MKX42_22965 [Paenibacillus sp. FSL R7-0204]|uniref:hypothetical protein n=1 Tax=Paenibacillus sp. FSL R7-0204 TaxID=2921675 RepID=UPI0030FA39FD